MVEAAEDLLQRADGGPVLMTGTCLPYTRQHCCGHAAGVEGGELTVIQPCE
jgi:hypothetical protein